MFEEKEEDDDVIIEEVFDEVVDVGLGELVDMGKLR